MKKIKLRVKIGKSVSYKEKVYMGQGSDFSSADRKAEEFEYTGNKKQLAFWIEAGLVEIVL